jgi:hypothetical protein
VGCVTAGDMGGDAQVAELAPVGIEVVAAVGEQLPGPAGGPAAAAADRRDRLDQRDELGDVVTVAAGEGDRQRDTAGVGDQVVLGTGPGPVHRGRPGVAPPLSARTCEASTAHRPRSSLPAARSSASSTSCSAGQTPAAVQSRSRRQHVTPEQPHTLGGSWFQAIPVLSTNTIPASAARSSARLRPGYRYRRGGWAGSSGATRSHSPSGTRSSITAARLSHTGGQAKQPRRSFRNDL